MKGKTLIGLTGTYCAGKNFVGRLLEARGLPVLDVDKLGHLVIEAEKERIVSRFGDALLDEEGRIDRKRLGERVFGKPGELAALEEIIHPGANRMTAEWISTRKEKACVINAALLHRSIVFNNLDAVIIVEAPFLVRMLRARRRDRLPWTVLLKRFLSHRKFNSQYSGGKTDIYRVSNPSGRGGLSGSLNPADSGLPTQGNKLEKRIDEILSLRGIDRV